ncbi:hypothetical protein NIES4071_85340 [Calothrix sp. NIES-4071]|nr:hypothetical protein NIES4071_85340 [Calothrix sp. NIES-4071]BAZ62801.1 hypothetical protein NIES4105_85270 [Calothrix sp. NIES-4105]
MNQKRPFISKSVDDLEIITKASKNNLELLKSIESELNFRDNKKAQILLTNISLLIKNIESVKPPSKNIKIGISSDSLSNDIFIYEQGILGYYGYRVGLNGLEENQRRQILDRIFLYPLPSINDAAYIKDWGEPVTKVRLKKMLDSIATFVKNAKRRNDKENYRKAIQDWEADLEYLKITYGQIKFNNNKLKEDYEKLVRLYDTEKVKADELTFQLDGWQQRAELNFQKYLDEQKKSQQVLHDYNEAKAKATELTTQRDEWQQRALTNEKDLTEAQQKLKTYQAEVDGLQERVTELYQTYLNQRKSCQNALTLYDHEKTRATQLVVQRDEWQQRAKQNEEAASQLVLVRQDIQTYQVEINDLKTRVTQNYQSYLEEQKNYQQALHRYHEAQTKATELIAQRDEWQQRALINQEAATQLTQVQQDIQVYQVKVNELKEQAAHNYQIYIDEQKNYQEALARYNEEKARANELLIQYEQVTSERDNYLTLYNEAQTQLKFERRSKASIKGWETRRKAENEKLKREIAEMVVLLRDSLASKDEAINNLYVVAERMDRIQSLVDSVEEDTTSNPVGLVQKFKRIWFAIKEILSE